ncbi:hypothetical protein ABB27_18025 [Stenotrophomonas terrae]|uniref:Lipoprotein n=1 Tax=Stenotrophomonas terrae TaxID=405446 RepID=A0A0R0BYK2_9GAMM|nr:DUF1684 domain-containing protein [Stenotrophomonas terrae]KRG62749.1 hypothetical protein ABB27_18025 [Stenotrophomonas terrae]
MKYLLGGAALIAVMLLGGCGDDANKAKPAAQVDPSFARDNGLWREQRLTELLATDGWTSLVGLHWLDLKAHYIGSGSTSGIRLAVGPPRMGLVTREGKSWFFAPEPGVSVKVDGQVVKGRIPLHSDHAETPTVIHFDDDKGSLSLIERGPRFGLRVKHADAPARAQFSHLDYWPADPSWRITARFVPNDVNKTLPIVDITGLTTELANAGAIEFERDGRTWRLEALGDAGRPLQVIFADRTSGRGSYAAGRYIDLDVPNGKSEVVIDFNRAYNPPCAFTAFATCPLPPPENRLDMAVEAGEKAYAKPKQEPAA